MTVARITDLGSHSNETVVVRGWVVTTRSSGKIAFLVLRDGSGQVQAVFLKKDIPEDVWQRFETLTQETSVEVTGVVRPDDRAPGGYELTATESEFEDTVPHVAAGTSSKDDLIDWFGNHCRPQP